MVGFERSNVFWNDCHRKTLFTTSVTEVTQGGFEEKYTLNPGEVLEIPANFGITGFAYSDNSVCYSNQGFNSYDTPNVFSVSNKKLPLFMHQLYGKRKALQY
jgi:hypothetical protein